MSAARPHSSPLLERVAFKTSRLAEFCGVEELTKRVGHPSDRWPLVILKEGVDNSRDACEEAKIAPEIDITVSADTGEITIIDNGPGIPPETVASIADYTIRTSSWHAYIAPTRGRQGNALQCAAAMPFALDGTQGATVIEARGQRHVIKFMMNRVHRRPDITHQTGDSDVQIGTRTTVRWPRNACPLLKAVKDQFVQLAAAYTTFNPHLTLRCWWDQKEISVAATTPEWHKWRACDPTSAHWYSRDTFERYAAAHVARDQEQGNIGRTVRDFISELRGLRRPDAQKLVLEETGSSRIPLADYFSQGETAIARLLHSCQHHTELVNPKKLGIIGEYHLFQHCVGLGAFAESFSYRKFCGMTDGGLPGVLEVAFGYCPGNTEAQIISGINFSIALGDPFQRLGPYNTLRGILGQQEIDYNDPVVVVLHYVSPVVDFSDHGKTTLTLPPEVGRKAAELIEAATKPWADQKRAERRRESARDNCALKLLKATPKRERRDPAEPTGILAEKISAAADELGVPIDSLTVLSPSADPYTAWRRRREAEWFARLFDRFVEPGAKKHLRGLFYRCASAENIIYPNGDRLVNNHKYWCMFLRAASAARWLGLVPFSRIIDMRNAEARIYVPPIVPISVETTSGDNCRIPDCAADAVPKFALDGFYGRQTHRIIFYGEKASLAEVIEPISVAVGAEMILVTGESSHTRLEEAIERASQDSRHAVLCYFADFDPSGHQMAISTARKVQALRDLLYPDLDIKIYRVALTIEQVRARNLPSKPLSDNEKRASNWKETFGHEQTEIDAMIELYPEKLEQAIYEVIAPFYDATLNQRVHKVENDWHDAANTASRDHPEYDDLSDSIEAAYDDVAEAVEKLHAEQERAVEILQENLPEPPELPEAAPTGTALPALFDSSVDFVTATHRLIADKKLTGVDNEDDDAPQVLSGLPPWDRCRQRRHPEFAAAGDVRALGGTGLGSFRK